MRNVIILLGMIACLFTPSAIFTIIGYKAIKTLGEHPTRSANVMIALITKLAIATAILITVLSFMLKFFATQR